MRFFFFFSFIIIEIIVSLYWIWKPFYEYIHKNKKISDAEAARQVGEFFPEIKDKLLNAIQLKNMSFGDYSLITASIEQKSKHFSTFPFHKAINFSASKKYAKYLLTILFCVGIVIFFIPKVVTEGTERIVKYEEEFVPDAPFRFILKNDSLLHFKNEDFTIKMSIEGNYIPEEVFLLHNGRSIKINKDKDDIYQYNFQKLLSKTKIQFEASGYKSAFYTIELRDRPSLKKMNIILEYPSYTKKSKQILENTGNIEIPEGTNVVWQLLAENTENIYLFFEKEMQPKFIKEKNFFSTRSIIKNSQSYNLVLENQYSKNKEKIQHYITVVKDEYPKLQMNIHTDTVFYRYIDLAGIISDDYGIEELLLFYKRNEADFQQKKIDINKLLGNQSFYYHWNLDSMNILAGEELAFYMQVSDNDKVNGNKSSKTDMYYVKIPSAQEINTSIHSHAATSEQSMNSTIQSTEQFQKELKSLEERLKTKKKLDWQDEKLLKDLIEKKQKRDEEIKKLQEEQNTLSEKMNKFSAPSDNIKEKMKKLEDLIKNLVDENTKKLLDDLKKLLDEKKELSAVQNKLNEMSKKEENFEKELDRAMEWFQQLQFEYQLEQVLKDSKELAQEQKKRAEKSEEGSEDMQGMKEEQAKLNEKTKNLKDNIKNLQEINKKLDNPEKIPNTEEEMKSLEKSQENALEKLEENKPDEAKKEQDKAAKEIEKISKKMEDMQKEREEMVLDENIEQLRNIVDDLNKLSFAQEDLMKKFKKIQQTDPQFVTYTQEQSKLKDDVKIINDSLDALAKRVFQISSFITREVSEMKEYMDESIYALKQRNKDLSVVKQQYAMTSINNLAVLLDDVLQNMRESAMKAKGKPQKKKGKQKGNSSLEQMQKELGEKMGNLKKQGTTGRELSEELAKLAAEQERIRELLQQENQKYGKNDPLSKKNIHDIIQKMEETEMDIVNKNITQKTMERQKEIVTRLLESEKSLRERELDEQRKAETAKNVTQKTPDFLEHYKQQNKKEIELLKTIPLKLNNYYKKEVQEYFKRVQE